MNYRNIQRITVARSALDVIAIIFLVCAFAFWSVAFWQLLAPPSLLSLWSVQAVVLALVYALATPLLWSMLVPTTPAGQLLQKTQWRTIGFAFVVAAAVYLSYQAEWMIETWLSYQPGIAEAGMARSLAISLSIAFILIPALAWVQLTPERWLQQIQQAHHVKKLEMMQRGDLAILRATLLKAERYALVDFVNLLPHERAEVYAAIQGLMIGINDQQHAISRLIGRDTELERNFDGDADIIAKLDSVKSAIDASDIRLVDAPAIETAPLARVPSSSGSHKTDNSLYTEPHKMARVPGTQGNARDDGEYTVAYEKFGTEEAWTVRDLASVLKVAESTARKTKIAWEEEGLVSGRGLSNGRYRFVS